MTQQTYSREPGLPMATLQITLCSFTGALSVVEKKTSQCLLTTASEHRLTSDHHQHRYGNYQQHMSATARLTFAQHPVLLPVAPLPQLPQHDLQCQAEPPLGTSH